METTVKNKNNYTKIEQVHICKMISILRLRLYDFVKLEDIKEISSFTLELLNSEFHQYLGDINKTIKCLYVLL